MRSSSFIIPSYNPGSDLLKCIKSLDGLDYDKNKYEIVVVDDGSPDDSLKKLEELNISNLRIFRNSHQGAAKTRNFGIEKAEKDTFIFLDQDVIVRNNLLQIYDHAFQLTNSDAVQGNIWEQVVDNNITKIHAKWRHLVFLNKVNDSDGFIKTIVTRNVAIRKKALNEIELKYCYIFDESIKGTGGEDRELGYRMHNLGFKIYLEPKAVVYHKDPDKLIGILVQKYKHAQGDVKHGIGERLFDLNNFKRTVIIPIKEGVPVYFAFLFWLFHIMGAESQRMKKRLNSTNIKLYFFLKRLMDIIGALVGLVIGFPILMLISILIKLDSKGPVIFKQKRLGAGRKEFKMFKFRTMVVDAEKILQSDPSLMETYKKSSYKIKDDPRVTKVGKILRKFSLDELTQLINILRGEMSIVGPRAYKKDEVENQLDVYPELKKHAELVMNVKPGLTGVWQISGRSEIGFEQRIVLDYNYANKASILFDILIILKTIPAVLKSKGAW